MSQTNKYFNITTCLNNEKPVEFDCNLNCLEQCIIERDSAGWCTFDIKVKTSFRDLKCILYEHVLSTVLFKKKKKKFIIYERIENDTMYGRIYNELKTKMTPNLVISYYFLAEIFFMMSFSSCYLYSLALLFFFFTETENKTKQKTQSYCLL